MLYHKKSRLKGHIILYQNNGLNTFFVFVPTPFKRHKEMSIAPLLSGSALFNQEYAAGFVRYDGLFVSRFSPATAQLPSVKPPQCAFRQCENKCARHNWAKIAFVEFIRMIHYPKYRFEMRKGETTNLLGWLHSCGLDMQCIYFDCNSWLFNLLDDLLIRNFTNSIKC